MKVCDYGCGQIGMFYFKTANKWCCSKNFKQCPEQRKLTSAISKGKLKATRSESHKLNLRKTRKMKSKLFNNLNHILCSYGCNQEAKFKTDTGKFCCCEYYSSCSGLKKLNSEIHKGKKIIGRKSSGPCSERKKEKLRRRFIGIPLGLEHKQKLSKSHIGQICWCKGKTWEEVFGKERASELKERASIYRTGKTWEDLYGELRSKELKEIQKQKMLNGQALKMIKCIKRVSNGELKLRNLIKEIFPSCEFQYGIFNYAVDIAIPEYKIIIEYDGWYHFDCQEHIDYHINRQKIIEDEGWIFIRYKYNEKFPTKEKIKEDIQKWIV